MEEKFNAKNRKQETSRREFIKLIIILSLFFGTILCLVLYFSWPLLTGTTIVLQPRPVDPFDIFRGQYLTINYDISSIAVVKGAAEGDSVYILLKKDESKNVWSYKGASLAKPSSGIFIKGDITFIYGDTMNVEYGVETYFFERNAVIPFDGMTVEIMLSSDGRARIVQLLQDGKPMAIKYIDSSTSS